MLAGSGPVMGTLIVEDNSGASGAMKSAPNAAGKLAMHSVQVSLSHIVLPATTCAPKGSNMGRDVQVSILTLVSVPSDLIERNGGVLWYGKMSHSFLCEGCAFMFSP